MTDVTAATLWPFAIVESRLIVAPEFLVRLGESDAGIRRLLINGTKVDQARSGALHQTVLAVPGMGDVGLAYRYVPVPGDARDRATRVLHVVEGVVCDHPAAKLADATLDRTRGQLEAPLRRYVAEGWSGPPAQSHGEPLDDAPTESVSSAQDAHQPPSTHNIGAWLRRQPVLLLFLVLIGGMAIVLLIVRRILSS